MNGSDYKDRLTIRHLDYLKRTLRYSGSQIKGTKWRSFEPKQNFYYANPSDIKHLKDLVDSGYMSIGDSGYYYVTDSGRAILSDIIGVEILPWKGKMDDAK